MYHLKIFVGRNFSLKCHERIIKRLNVIQKYVLGKRYRDNDHEIFHKDTFHINVYFLIEFGLRIKLLEI